jgi:hypothetical protein
MKYFSIENSVDRVHGLVDRAAPWSTVDRRHQSSLRWRGEGEGNGAELTEVKIGRRGGEVAPAAERNGTRRQCSVLGGSGHG